MTAATLTRPKARVRPTCQSARSSRHTLPTQPGQPLWNSDKAKAFEAGVRWFLAVSRAA
jgi:hypothetical protein